MTINEMINPARDDKPLDTLVTDGGYMGIFRKVAFIGDSLSSGEFESNVGDATTYHDLYDYSWGQFIARDAGLAAYNFSRGGMTCKEYLQSFAEENGFWDKDKACQAYVIALGFNDMYGLMMEMGSVFTDFNVEKPEESKETIAGLYARIIAKYKEIQPKARFFLVSAPISTNPNDECLPRLNKMLHELAEYFEFTYVVYLYTYGPHHDEEFRKNFYLYGHLNPMGYRDTARIVESYIDWIIRHNMDDFKQIGLIGTEAYDPKLDEKA